MPKINGLLSVANIYRNTGRGVVIKDYDYFQVVILNTLIMCIKEEDNDDDIKEKDVRYSLVKKCIGPMTKDRYIIEI